MRQFYQRWVSLVQQDSRWTWQQNSSQDGDSSCLGNRGFTSWVSHSCNWNCLLLHSNQKYQHYSHFFSQSFAILFTLCLINHILQKSGFPAEVTSVQVWKMVIFVSQTQWCIIAPHLNFTIYSSKPHPFAIKQLLVVYTMLEKNTKSKISKVH